MARNRLTTELLVVHCAATKPSMDIGADEIHRWHVKRGIYSERGPTGYHFIIRRDGSVEIGRELRETGAHCLGYNDESLGVCLVGGIHQTKTLPDGTPMPEDNFLAPQFDALRGLIQFARLLWPTILVGGHNKFANRACPSFDLDTWLWDEFGHDDADEIVRYIARGEGDTEW